MTVIKNIFDGIIEDHDKIIKEYPLDFVKKIRYQHQSGSYSHHILGVTIEQIIKFMFLAKQKYKDPQDMIYALYAVIIYKIGLASLKRRIKLKPFANFKVGDIIKLKNHEEDFSQAEGYYFGGANWENDKCIIVNFSKNSFGDGGYELYLARGWSDITMLESEIKGYKQKEYTGNNYFKRRQFIKNGSFAPGSIS